MANHRTDPYELRAERDRTRQNLKEDWTALRAGWRRRRGKAPADAAHAGRKPEAKAHLGAGGVLAALIGFGLVVPRIFVRGRLPLDPPKR